MLTTGAARAVITVTSRVTLTEGVRAQAEVTKPTGFDERGDTITAVAIKEIHSTIFLRDLGPTFPTGTAGGTGALIVQKRTLTNFETYGQGDPRGWLIPPISDPTPPWVGLVWPYRDQYDYFGQPGNPSVPLGNDVGTFFFDEPDVYQFLNVVALERGGPTDPITRPDGGPGGGDEDWLQRGITGNGLGAPATYFAFDVFNNNFTQGAVFDHTVRLRIIAAEAIVVVRNAQGQFSELKVPIDDFEITFPEPTTALAGSALLGLLAMRRRR